MGKIMLNLDRSRTSRAFNDGESLWTHEIAKIRSRLWQHRNALPQRGPRKQQEPQRTGEDWPRDPGFEEPPVLTIAIFGTYGAGKSSLLETLARKMNKEGHSSRRHGPNGSTSEHLPVFSLPVLRPNPDARDDHLLYAFLALALEADRKQEHDTDSLTPRQHTARLLTPVQQSFQEASEYLQVLDEVGDAGAQDFDPLGASLDRLERHTSDLHLQEKLNDFINRLADALAGRPDGVVLLPIDDADYSKKLLLNTLNSYRRYLSHPRLVPVFSFTGRVAEELLCASFNERLALSDDERLQRKNRLALAEQLALQYLSQLFPVRNRIRLGPAPARVQAASYTTHEGSPDKKNGKPVIDLLKESSRRLFGDSEESMEPSVRIALRPASLRKQLQVLDAMHSLEINRELTEKDQEKTPDQWKWMNDFDVAVWSLFNVHRDVLREVGLSLDDLYGWTPKALREEILAAILNLDRDQRRHVLRRWRYRTEDRRGQVLSLLGVAIFRPEMEFEKPWGDDPEKTERWAKRLSKEKAQEKAQETEKEFLAARSFEWFFNLWMGFYLPQILARDRRNKFLRTASAETASANDVGPVRAIGWDPWKGPVQAVRELLAEREIYSSGMLLLSPEDFPDILGVEPSSTEEWTDSQRNMLDVWCFRGNETGQAWAAASIWRGLSLLHQLLSMAFQTRVTSSSNDDEVPEARVKAILKNHRRNRVKAILENHRRRGRVNSNHADVRPGDFGETRFSSKQMKLDEGFLEEILTWLEAPFNQGNSISDTWQHYYLSRLHGENMVGTLWTNLQASRFENPGPEGDQRETLDNAMKKWTGVLVEYWEKSEIRSLLEKCPFVRPFVEPEEEDSERIKPFKRIRQLLQTRFPRDGRAES